MSTYQKNKNSNLKGFVVGAETRRRLSAIETIDKIEEIMAGVDFDQDLPPEAARSPRGHTHGPRPVKLPHGYLNDPEAMERLPKAAGIAVSGG
jgi:hypothetical protein